MSKNFVASEIVDLGLILHPLLVVKPNPLGLNVPHETTIRNDDGKYRELDLVPWNASDGSQRFDDIEIVEVEIANTVNDFRERA